MSPNQREHLFPHRRYTPKPVNTAMGDKLGLLTFATLFPDADPVCNDRSAAGGSSTPTKRVKRKPYERGLRLYNAVPERDTTNFIQVKWHGKDAWYPIHSWSRIRDLCEWFYRDRPFLQVRAASRRAMISVVQRYLDEKGVCLIPRSVIERAIGIELEKMFPLRHGHAQAKRTPEVMYPAEKPRDSYEERIRLYRERCASAMASTPSQRRSDKYINEKKARFSGDIHHSFPAAFTVMKENARTVWVGLDFGTQNIKAMFRDSEDEAERAVVLEFAPESTGISRFMFSPSLRVTAGELSFVRDGVRPEPSWKHVLSFLFGKSYTEMDDAVVAWIRRAQRQDAALACYSLEDLAIFFTSFHLAWVLQTVGQNIKSYYRTRDVRSELAFRVYMCAPAAVMDDQLGKLVFQDCLTHADQLHGLFDFSRPTISLRDATDGFERIRRLGVLLEPRLCRRSRVVPEVLAEMASYAQSRIAREGVYALVDIGAGTADLNVFKVVAPTQQNDYTTPIYATGCHPHGVQHLESLLCQSMGVAAESAHAAFEMQKADGVFPDYELLARLSSDALAARGALRTGVETYHGALLSSTSDTWGQAFGRRGRETEPWQHLKLFMCGGGASVVNVEEVLRRGIPGQMIKDVTTVVLPCPGADEFVRPDGFPEESFHRVAVAYGLTFGSDYEDRGPEDAGRQGVLPGDHVQDSATKLNLRRETVDIEERFVSKDSV